MFDSDTAMTNIVASRSSSVRKQLNLHHAERSAAAAHSIRQTLCHLPPLTYLLRTSVSLPNLTLSACYVSLPSQSLSHPSVDTRPRAKNIISAVTLPRSAGRITYHPRHVQLVIIAVENYGVLEPEAS